MVAYPLSKQRDIPIHVKMVVVASVSMERQWWWRTPSFEQESSVCWCFSLRPMDGILHMLAKCWRRPWCALSMVRDQSQIGLYIHRIVARGGYRLTAECCLVSPYLWKMHPTRFELVACMVLLKIPWRYLWKLGYRPLKSCSRGDAYAWTGCL